MGIWNESSVNTVRIPSFLNSQGFFIMDGFFRTGRQGAIVDNGGAGGIFASFDAKTGLITSDGKDENGNTFVVHPDTGVKYKGWQIPNWQNLLKIVEFAHRHNMSKHKYIGWDFALTDDGWILIEGNWGQLLCQYANKKGLKNEFFERITN